MGTVGRQKFDCTDLGIGKNLSVGQLVRKESKFDLTLLPQRARFQYVTTWTFNYVFNAQTLMGNGVGVKSYLKI